MAESVWSQDVFSKGELSPLLYSRVTVDAYYKGLKHADNVLTFPQGAAGKRFGTQYLNQVTGATNYREIAFETFQYLNECTYILCFVPGFIKIYLEGVLIAEVSTTITSSIVPLMDVTVLDNAFRVTTGVLKPKDLTRHPSSAHTITGFTSTTFTLSTGETAGYILPVLFTTSGAYPDTTPQIIEHLTYFAYFIDATTVEIYGSAEDAKARVNKLEITSIGSGTNNMIPQNVWHFEDIAFTNFPTYDFVGGYDKGTFTPSAVTGNGITLTFAPGVGDTFVFTSDFVGGSFVGNGGAAQIATFISATQVTINIVRNFKDALAIPGRLSLVRQPAWSDTLGWPSKCSSFQNRAVFANSRSLANGVWLSVSNDFVDFYDLEDDDDFAISWYPSSDNVNYIRFIVPYRSLTIHTNSGIYSTPLSFETAVTPNNFSMTLQDSTPATSIQPRGIDNQIIILSGNDVHSMLWDGFNNSYTSTIASVSNEHLIRDPHDECEYVDLARAGSRYMFIINGDGTMAIFQTLISEGVQGFTPASLYQTYGNAYFRWATSSTEGRAWFLTEREIGVNGDASVITGFTQFTLDVGVNFELLDDNLFDLLSGDVFELLEFSAVFPIGVPTPFQFTTTDSLPTSSPQVETGRFYWAVALPSNEFEVYLNAADAADGVNKIEFFDAGVDTSVVPLVLETQFFIEELDFDAKVDCAGFYDGSPTSQFTGQSRFNGQTVSINGDGFGFSDECFEGTIDVEAHGSSVDVNVAQFGFPIHMVISPLQVAPPGAVGPKGSSLVFAQHIRLASFVFVDTIGGTINGQPITLNKFADVVPNVAPIPRTGVMQVSIMKGWNEPLESGITIEHSDPYDIKLTGIFYKIEV